jgi:hypothetical protein
VCFTDSSISHQYDLIHVRRRLMLIVCLLHGYTIIRDTIQLTIPNYHATVASLLRDILSSARLITYSTSLLLLLLSILIAIGIGITRTTITLIIACI